MSSKEMNLIETPVLRVPAKLVSYLLHPLFIPTYVFFFLICQFPYEFAGITEWQLKMLLYGLYCMTAFIPA